jgi:hypothetical protein
LVLLQFPGTHHQARDFAPAAEWHHHKIPYLQTGIRACVPAGIEPVGKRLVQWNRQYDFD